MSITNEQVPGVPDGWELVRIGAPLNGEYYINSVGSAELAGHGHVSRNWSVIRKLPSWRPAKPSDLDGGTPVQARFRDNLDDDWIEGCFGGYIVDAKHRLQFRRDCANVKGYEWHRYCEVLDS